VSSIQLICRISFVRPVPTRTRPNLKMWSRMQSLGAAERASGEKTATARFPLQAPTQGAAHALRARTPNAPVVAPPWRVLAVHLVAKALHEISLRLQRRLAAQGAHGLAGRLHGGALGGRLSERHREGDGSLYRLSVFVATFFERRALLLSGPRAGPYGAQRGGGAAEGCGGGGRARAGGAARPPRAFLPCEAARALMRCVRG